MEHRTLRLIVAIIALTTVNALKFGHRLSSAPATLSNVDYQVKYYQQKVDHFSYSNLDTFKQRYIISNKYWKLNGPIWFYAGNEGDIFTFANNTGFMWDNAKQFSALIIFMEHRYYGESMPYGNQSMSKLNHLGFLTVEQALADYADFIYDLKLTTEEAHDSPVIMFGGSYGGMLAAWFRIKYPHLCVGALAASAPILQFPDIYNCEGYNQIVTRDFENYSPKCVQTIHKSWDAIKRLGSTEDGRRFLTRQFALCDELKEKDLQTFTDWIIDIWSTLPMIDYPNPANFLTNLPAYPIKVICGYLTDTDADDQKLLTSISKGIAVYTNYSGDSECNQLANKDDERLGTSAWNFQACTEMVLPQCSDGVDDFFPPNKWDMSQYADNCKQKYGVGAERYKALWMFGGSHIHGASNIIFSNGERDPWSAGGVLDSLSDSLIAIRIKGACHHEDLRSQGPADPPSLLHARELELKIIRKWLQEYYQSAKIKFEF